MSQQDRARHSCETCRRKKTKCTAERPVCSICQRQNQQCVYLPRYRPSSSHGHSKVSKSGSDDRARVELLESQVTNLYELINQISGNDSAISPNSTASRRGNLNASMVVPGTSTEAARFSRTISNTPPQTLDQCIQVYKTKIHAQPLHLFKINQLADTLLNSPQYLLRSFLALTLRLCTPEFFKDTVTEAITYYSDSAHQLIEVLVRQGTARADMVQALCLLALSEVMSYTPAKAWMTIGMAGRVQTLRRMINPDHRYRRNEDDVRCDYAVFILERMFCCCSPHSVFRGDLVSLPESPSVPLPPLQASNFSQPTLPRSTPGSDDNASASFATPDQNIQDFGINVSCVKAIAIWSDVVSYLQEVKIGKADIPEPSGAVYQQWNARVYDCDAHLSNNHLLRNVLLNKRSLEDLSQHQEYWSAWTLTQIATHGSQAIINHPFIHLILPRERGPTLQSRVFQQQTVDQALNHSGWVARLIRGIEDARLEINDPLIGNIVAAVATIPWLFQFARDQKVAKRAKRDVATCEQLLSRMSNTWTQFISKLNYLRELQLLAENSQLDTPRRNLTVTFKPGSVWELLDSDITQNIRDNSSDKQHSSENQTFAEAVVRIATKFVHPLEQGEDSTTAVHNDAQIDTQFEVDATPLTQGSHEPSMLDLFLQLDPDDFQWMQPNL